MPWVSKGLTAVPDGGGDALFGYSGRGFDNWMSPGQRGELTQLVFVGPDSPNPESDRMGQGLQQFRSRRRIRLAGSLVRRGPDDRPRRLSDELTCSAEAGSAPLTTALANPPGSSYTATFNGGPGMEYLDLTTLEPAFPRCPFR